MTLLEHKENFYDFLENNQGSKYQSTVMKLD